MRRPISTLALSLLLGLLSTILIAIACGLTIDPPYGHPRGRVVSDHAFITAGIPWSVTQWHRPGATLLLWDELTRDYFTVPTVPTAAAPIPPLPKREDPELLIHDYLASAEEDEKGPLARATPIPHIRTTPTWGQFAARRAPSLNAANPGTLSGADIGYGWPCVALWYQVLGYQQHLTSSQTSHHGAVVLQGIPQLRGQFHCRVIPYLPAYRGLLLNTLLYTALWSILFFSIPTLRRALRKRRNQCPHCAYSRAGLTPQSPCPECGSPKP